MLFPIVHSYAVMSSFFFFNLTASAVSFLRSLHTEYFIGIAVKLLSYRHCMLQTSAEALGHFSSQVVVSFS